MGMKRPKKSFTEWLDEKNRGLRCWWCSKKLIKETGYRRFCVKCQ